jgi:hypothetical protein
MFYPTLLGKMLLKFLLGDGNDLPFVVKNDRSGTGSSLIQRQYVRFTLGHVLD